MKTSCHPKLCRINLRLFVLTLLALAGCTTQSANYVSHDITGVMPDLEFTLTNEKGIAK